MVWRPSTRPAQEPDGDRTDRAVLTDHARTTTAYVAARNLLIDQNTAAISTSFEDAGIACMLIKGPVIADWLYRDDIRLYGDSDLLVLESDWGRAVAILTELGYGEAPGTLAHPRMTDTAARSFVRGLAYVDLHRTIEGLDAPPGMVWDALHAGAERQEVGGREMVVPGRAARLMHLALHAAHHGGEAKSCEDLRRGVLAEDEDAWREAAALAARLGGSAAFGAGLRNVPESAALARRLGVADTGSVLFDLRAAGVPTAEGLHELLNPGHTAAERWTMIRAELFPQPSFMRWWTPLARRGGAGLLASYPMRWGWLVLRVPGGLLTLRRVRRRRADGRPAPRDV
jgi:hypothetical protein